MPSPSVQDRPPRAMPQPVARLLGYTLPVSVEDGQVVLVKPGVDLGGWFLGWDVASRRVIGLDGTMLDVEMVRPGAAPPVRAMRRAPVWLVRAGAAAPAAACAWIGAKAGLHGDPAAAAGTFVGLFALAIAALSIAS